MGGTGGQATSATRPSNHSAVPPLGGGIEGVLNLAGPNDEEPLQLPLGKGESFVKTLYASTIVLTLPVALGVKVPLTLPDALNDRESTWPVVASTTYSNGSSLPS